MTTAPIDLHPLTLPYVIPEEEWMLRNVVDDMRRGNIRHEVRWNAAKTEAVVWSEPKTCLTQRWRN
jgi:hypothetical protein